MRVDFTEQKPQTLADWIVARDYTQQWVLHYYHLARGKQLPWEMDRYPPLLLNALIGAAGEQSDAYMVVAMDRADAERKVLAARKAARTGWTEYHAPRLTGDPVTDAWERAILEGREPDW
tara:strand:+ start:33 stop:392 length:360 start_codon:yes stop_codon:yes gene_type:complete